MRTLFVTRHAGAIEWLHRHGLREDAVLDHLSLEDISPGDQVIGSLPINLIATLCEMGATYYNIDLHVPKELRGKELGPDQMDQCGARLMRYEATREDCTPKRTDTKGSLS